MNGLWWIWVMIGAEALAGGWLTASMLVDLRDMTRRRPISRVAARLHRGWWPAYTVLWGVMALAITVLITSSAHGIAVWALTAAVGLAAVAWWPRIRRFSRTRCNLDTGES